MRHFPQIILKFFCRLVCERQLALDNLPADQAGSPPPDPTMNSPSLCTVSAKSGDFFSHEGKPKIAEPPRCGPSPLQKLVPRKWCISLNDFHNERNVAQGRNAPRMYGESGQDLSDRTCHNNLWSFYLTNILTEKC